MTEGGGAAYLPTGDDLRAVDSLRSAEVLVGVCALNQARSAARVVGAALAALATALADRKGAIVVVARHLGSAFIIGSLAAIGLGYAFCVGLGAVYVRFAMARR